MKKLIKILAAITALLLLIACWHLPIAYYTYLRIIVSLVSVILLIEAIIEKHYPIAIVCGVICAIFNPIRPVYLHSKSVWVIIDLACAIWFGVRAAIGYEDVANRNNLFSTVSRAVGRKITSVSDLMEINPKDVESRIGLGAMSVIEPISRELGWGTNEYWNELMRNAQQADRNFCFAHSFKIFYFSYMEMCQAENEYKMHPEQFEDMTIIRDSKPFVKTKFDDYLDLEDVCDVLDKVRKYMESNDEKEITSDVVDTFNRYSLDIDDLIDDNIYILPSLKIAVRRKNISK